jgi:Pin2-interacting protein X1
MLGIGMQHQNDPDGIAWRQNRDFENVLRRLNNETTVETSGMGSFHKANEGGEVEEVVAIDESNGESTTTKKDKKREKGKKRKVVEREEEDETIDKERSEDKKKRKKRRKSRNDDGQPVSDVAHEAEASSQSALPTVVSAATPTNVVPQALPIRAPYVHSKFRLVVDG